MIKKLIHKLVSLTILYTKGGVSFAQYIGVSVGSNCRIYTTNFGSEPFLITIGNNVTVTSGVKFLTHDGTGWLMIDDKGRRYLYSKIEIGDSVFIGVNAILMPGVKVDNNVIIAPGSVVTKSVPSGVIIAGVPAKIIGKYADLEQRMLSGYISDQDIDKFLPYKDRVLKVLNKNMKPYMTQV